MTPVELTALRRIYGEICRGYSETTWRGNPVYVAHLTTFGQTDIDAAQELAYEEAVARGVKTEKERLHWLEVNKIWTAKDETSLTHERVYVENLEKTYSKLTMKVQRDTVMKQLVEGRDKLSHLITRRYCAIGVTAERVAEQKVQYEYIRLSFYSDPDLENRIFANHDLRALSDEDSDDLLISYVDISDRFTHDNIRRIAVQHFFSNQFSLCGKAVHTFFDIPIVDLTIYQTNLLLWGRHYQSVFENHKVPPDIAGDPAKIDDYMNRSANAKAMMAKANAQEGGRVGIVGASAEDFQVLGTEDGTSKMQGFAKKGYTDARDAARDMGYTSVDPKR